MYNILVGNWTLKSIWKQKYLIFSFVYVLQKNNILNLFQYFTTSSYYLWTRSDIANCPAINLINELIIYCLLFAAPYPDSQRAVCSAAGGLVPRPCLRPLASHYSTRYSAEPEFLNFKEPGNCFQGISSASYVAWRAGTATLFLLV